MVVIARRSCALKGVALELCDIDIVDQAIYIYMYVRLYAYMLHVVNNCLNCRSYSGSWPAGIRIFFCAHNHALSIDVYTCECVLRTDTYYLRVVHARTCARHITRTYVHCSRANRVQCICIFTRVSSLVKQSISRINDHQVVRALQSTTSIESARRSQKLIFVCNLIHRHMH